MSFHLTYPRFIVSGACHGTHSRLFLQGRKRWGTSKVLWGNELCENKDTGRPVETPIDGSSPVESRLHTPRTQDMGRLGSHKQCWAVDSKRGDFQFLAGVRNFSSDRGRPPLETERAKYFVSKDEAKSLVDEPSAMAYLEAYSPISNIQTAAQRDHAAISKSEDGYNDIIARDTSHGLYIALRDKGTSQARIWEIYQNLPKPRCSFLPRQTLKLLLGRLAYVPRKSTAGMLRYLSLISDMKESGLAIPLKAWNSAISFAGSCVKIVTAKEVESALYIWRDMEQRADVTSNHVTFNILFDVAAKAEKFVLAEMILKEMAARELEYNRYFRTSLILYYGLRADGDGVRKAYAELIDAGEIIDTAVINCVIKALVNCGEIAAAEMVFGREKELHASKATQNLPPVDWRDKKALGRSLDDAARALREATAGSEQDESSRSAASQRIAHLRQETSVAPDLTTYNVLIKHYAVVLGDIDRTAQLIDEMPQYGIEISGGVFWCVFRAFVIHGGVLYTQWTRRRLENTWAAFVETLDADEARREKHNAFFDTNEAIQQRSLEHISGDQISFVETYEGLATEESDVASDKQYESSLPEAQIDYFENPSEQLTAQKYEEPSIKYVSALEQDPDEEPKVYIGRSMAQLIGEAFGKCTDLGRTAEIWAQVRQRWVPEFVSEADEVEATIAASFPGHEELFRQKVDSELQRSTR